jgi:outer membrane protein TolC
LNIARFVPAALLAGVALIAPAVASATPMSLADAVRYALAHSQTVLQRSATVAQAEAALAKQKTLTYPTVNGQLQNQIQKNSNFSGSFAVIGVSQQNIFSQNTASIGTQYTLNAGGLGLIQLAESQAQVDQAKADLNRAEDQIASDATTAFFGIAQKDAIVALDLSDLAYQRLLVSAAQAKENAGVAAGVDVLRAQVAEKQSESNLVAARADTKNARELLAQSISAPVETDFAVPATIGQPALPNGSVDTLVAIAENARPDVASARFVLRNASLVRKGYDRELFPTINLNGSLGNQFSPTNAVAQQNAIDQQFFATNQQRIAIGLPPLPLSQKAIVPRGSPGYWAIGATTTFTLPFVDYGARHAERASDDAALASAQGALDVANGQAEVDVRQAYRAAQTALSQLQFAQDESRLGVEAARIAQLQYQNGIIALSDVSQAEQTSIKAQSDLIDARVAYVTAIVKLRVALGTYDAQSAVADLGGLTP